jgi:hypothetical protein
MESGNKRKSVARIAMPRKAALRIINPRPNWTHQRPAAPSVGWHTDSAVQSIDTENRLAAYPRGVATQQCHVNPVLTRHSEVFASTQKASK